MQNPTRGVLNYYDHRRWAYQNPIPVVSHSMLLQELLDLKAEQEETFDKAMEDFRATLVKVSNPKNWRLAPDWAKLIQLQYQNGRAVRNVERVADRLVAELKADVRRAIKPWWCQYGKFGTPAIKSKKNKMLG